MTRLIQHGIWNYFEKIKDSEKKALCQICHQKKSYMASSGNLTKHLKLKHHDAFKELKAAEKLLKQSLDNSSSEAENIAYEYVVEAASPTSSISNETHSITFIDTKQSNSTDFNNSKSSRESRSSISEKRRKIPQDAKGNSREKHLNEQLAEEKVAVANLQKQVIQKEMEEKNLKILLLQEEMKHRKYIYEQEKHEMEHKKYMSELEKEEKMLKIEMLKINLANLKKNEIQNFGD